MVVGDSYSKAAETAADLRKNGVPQEVILGENKSSFTKENAFYARQLADEYGLSIRKAINFDELTEEKK